MHYWKSYLADCNCSVFTTENYRCWRVVVGVSCGLGCVLKDLSCQRFHDLHILAVYRSGHFFGGWVYRFPALYELCIFSILQVWHSAHNYILCKLYSEICVTLRAVNDCNYLYTVNVYNVVFYIQVCWVKEKSVLFQSCSRLKASLGW